MVYAKFKLDVSFYSENCGIDLEESPINVLDIVNPFTVVDNTTKVEEFEVHHLNVEGSTRNVDSLLPELKTSVSPSHSNFPTSQTFSFLQVQGGDRPNSQGANSSLLSSDTLAFRNEEDLQEPLSNSIVNNSFSVQRGKIGAKVCHEICHH